MSTYSGQRVLLRRVVEGPHLFLSSDHHFFVLCRLQGENSGEYILILCNAIGSPVDSKYIEVRHDPRLSLPGYRS